MNAQTLIAAFSALVALTALGVVYKVSIDPYAITIAEIKRDLASLKEHSHNIAGPQGKTGDQGPRGPKGEKGDPGPKGEKGDSFPPEDLIKIKQEVFKNRQSASGILTEVKGGTHWGVWKEPAFCPDNHYVCGISQRVEGNQGRRDDTAVNDLQIYCCKF